jgi:HNH endonuclease
MSKLIPLTKGQHVIVNDEDYEWLGQWRWLLLKKYAARFVTHDGRRRVVFMHRLIMNAPDDMQVDHINHNKLDCRRSNLRLATSFENNRNRVKTTAKRSSRYKGVSFYKQTKRWGAYIRINGKHTYIGYYADEQSAARAYDRKAIELYGDFACLNFSE